MPKKNERAAFDTIMTKEMHRLCDKGGYTFKKELLQRRLNYMWKVFCGFNTKGNFNEMLDKLLLKFIKIRLGARSSHG